MASYTANLVGVQHVRILTHGAVSYLSTVSPLLLDTVPPIVSLVSPAEMTELQRNTPIVIDVTDANLGFHVIFAYYQDVAGLYEVVFGGVWPQSEGNYVLARSVISGGYRYSITRRGGWPAAPRIQVRATDLGNGEVL
jgi:hypothetical protein